MASTSKVGSAIIFALDLALPRSRAKWPSGKGSVMTKKRLIRLTILLAIAFSFEAAASKGCDGSWVWGPMNGYQCVVGGMNDGECTASCQ